ncbi:Chromo domain protein [Pseudocohnilembus persalinus]|uniref:Chromo domain protein n=1 Tax=Pseudocohnilembus persalinus TaxID=266149 RepID=A0A0V0QQ98_PSEPJ|nr:Chromo domain protein [Pseudocohnilembus persalinus]|eukprot:KRX04133.1 Chromo domain protein [Pseudocohnilembus persalinus]
MSQQENIYSVEKIVKYKMIKGKETFLVKWQDYPSSENTWEPKEHLLPHCQFMIDDGNQQMQQEQQVQQQQQQQIDDLDKKQQNPNSNQQSPNENEANQQYLNQKKITYKIFEQRNRKYPHILDKVNLETDSCDNKQQNANNYNKCTNEQQYNQDEEFIGKIRKGSFKYETNVENFRFLVKWKYNQKYKILPEQSQVTRKSLKENDIDALVDFYESKIKIHSNH